VRNNFFVGPLGTGGGGTSTDATARAQATAAQTTADALRSTDVQSAVIDDTTVGSEKIVITRTDGSTLDVDVSSLAGAGGGSAAATTYSNLTAVLAGNPTNVQGAIDALDAGIDALNTAATAQDTSIAAEKTRNDAQDTKIAALEATMPTKADATAVNTALAGKADQAALDAVVATNATQAELDAVEAALNAAIALKPDVVLTDAVRQADGTILLTFSDTTTKSVSASAEGAKFYPPIVRSTASNAAPTTAEIPDPIIDGSSVLIYTNDFRIVLYERIGGVWVRQYTEFFRLVSSTVRDTTPDPIVPGNLIDYTLANASPTSISRTIDLAGVQLGTRFVFSGGTSVTNAGKTATYTFTNGAVVTPQGIISELTVRAYEHYTIFVSQTGGGSLRNCHIIPSFGSTGIGLVEGTLLGAYAPSAALPDSSQVNSAGDFFRVGADGVAGQPFAGQSLKEGDEIVALTNAPADATEWYVRAFSTQIALRADVRDTATASLTEAVSEKAVRDRLDPLETHATDKKLHNPTTATNGQFARYDAALEEWVPADIEINSSNTVSGPGAPSNTAGTASGDAADGFYYEQLDAAKGTNDIWGPKAAGAWPAQADFRSADPEDLTATDVVSVSGDAAHNKFGTISTALLDLHLEDRQTPTSFVVNGDTLDLTAIPDLRQNIRYFIRNRHVTDNATIVFGAASQFTLNLVNEDGFASQVLAAPANTTLDLDPNKWMILEYNENGTDVDAFIFNSNQYRRFATTPTDPVSVPFDVLVFIADKRELWTNVTGVTQKFTGAETANWKIMYSGFPVTETVLADGDTAITGKTNRVANGDTLVLPAFENGKEFAIATYNAAGTAFATVVYYAANQAGDDWAAKTNAGSIDPDDITEWTATETDIAQGALRKVTGTPTRIFGRIVADAAADGGTSPDGTKWQDITDQNPNVLSVIDSSGGGNRFAVYGEPSLYEVTGTEDITLLFPTDGGNNANLRSQVYNKGTGTVTIEGEAVTAGGVALIQADAGVDGPFVWASGASEGGGIGGEQITGTTGTSTTTIAYTGDASFGWQAEVQVNIAGIDYWMPMNFPANDAVNHYRAWHTPGVGFNFNNQGANINNRPYRITVYRDIGQVGYILDSEVVPVEQTIAANPLAADEEVVTLDGIEVRMSFAARQMQIRAATGTIEIEGHHSLEQGTSVEGDSGTKTLTTTWQNLDITDETFSISGAQEWFHFRRTDTNVQYLVRSRLGSSFNNNSIIFEKLGAYNVYQGSTEAEVTGNVGTGGGTIQLTVPETGNYDVFMKVYGAGTEPAETGSGNFEIEGSASGLVTSETRILRFGDGFGFTAVEPKVPLVANEVLTMSAAAFSTGGFNRDSCRIFIRRVA